MKASIVLLASLPTTCNIVKTLLRDDEMLFAHEVYIYRLSLTLSCDFLTFSFWLQPHFLSHSPHLSLKLQLFKSPSLHLSGLLEVKVETIIRTFESGSMKS